MPYATKSITTMEQPASRSHFANDVLNINNNC